MELVKCVCKRRHPYKSLLFKHIQLISSLSGHVVCRIISSSLIVSLLLSRDNRCQQRQSTHLIVFCFVSAQVELLLNRSTICQCHISSVILTNFLLLLLFHYSNGFYTIRWENLRSRFSSHPSCLWYQIYIESLSRTHSLSLAFIRVWFVRNVFSCSKQCSTKINAEETKFNSAAQGSSMIIISRRYAN